MDGGPMPKPEGVSIGDGKAESATTAAPARDAPQRRQAVFFAKLWYPQPFSPHFQSPARKGTTPLPPRIWPLPPIP